jgi:hypothetical protein
MSEHTDSARRQMDKCLKVLQENFAKVRTGRANPHILDDIKVDYYGQPTPIMQLAGVKVPEASMLVVEPWDKSSLKARSRRPSRLRPRHHPVERRHLHQASVPEAHRGAPQGARQGVQASCRGGKGLHPQRPPRCQRQAESATTPSPRTT